MTKIRGDIEEAKGNVQEELVPETEMLKQRLEWFQDLKFGVIFHYGLYAEAGIVESWQLSEKARLYRALFHPLPPFGAGVRDREKI